MSAREVGKEHALRWGINPVSLEHKGRSRIVYGARSFGIIGLV
jgi:hypothetical protein